MIVERRPHRVMFVDDETSILSVMKRVFRREPYEIRYVDNGVTALEMFDEFRPGVIVSDHRMPGMTGTELLARIRERDPDTVRIILTGHTDLSVAEAAINSGQVYRFLTKPWNDDELRAAVSAGAETYSLRDERARLVERLEQLNSSLEGELASRTHELDRARPLADVGLLAAGIAHELNNPLGGLLAITQLKLSDAEPGSQDEEDLQFMEEAALRCKAIIADLMSLAEPHRDTERAPICVEAAIEAGLQLLAPETRDSFPIQRNYTANTPRVLANTDQISRIVMNLAQNGLCAGDVVHIETRYDDASVQVVISDDGPGIPYEARRQIFKPFFTTRPVGEGAGLGLAVARALALANDGKLSLEHSEPGETRFVLTLPVAREEA